MSKVTIGYRDDGVIVMDVELPGNGTACVPLFSDEARQIARHLMVAAEGLESGEWRKYVRESQTTDHRLSYKSGTGPRR